MAHRYEYAYMPGHPLAGAGGIVWIHRLVVWNAGVDPRGMDVHHINGDSRDNRLENLEVLTRREHSFRHPRERPTHCRHGHQYTEFDYVKNGKRVCKICAEVSRQKYRAKQQAVSDQS